MTLSQTQPIKPINLLHLYFRLILRTRSSYLFLSFFHLETGVDFSSFCILYRLPLPWKHNKSTITRIKSTVYEPRRRGNLPAVLIVLFISSTMFCCNCRLQDTNFITTTPSLLLKLWCAMIIWIQNTRSILLK